MAERWCWAAQVLPSIRQNFSTCGSAEVSVAATAAAASPVEHTQSVPLGALTSEVERESLHTLP